MIQLYILIHFIFFRMSDIMEEIDYEKLDLYNETIGIHPLWLTEDHYTINFTRDEQSGNWNVSRNEKGEQLSSPRYSHNILT